MNTYDVYYYERGSLIPTRAESNIEILDVAIYIRDILAEQQIDGVSVIRNLHS